MYVHGHYHHFCRLARQNHRSSNTNPTYKASRQTNRLPLAGLYLMPLLVLAIQPRPLRTHEPARATLTHQCRNLITISSQHDKNNQPKSSMSIPVLSPPPSRNNKLPSSQAPPTLSTALKPPKPLVPSTQASRNSTAQSEPALCSDPPPLRGANKTS